MYTDDMYCPLSMDLFKDPVITDNGITYEKEYILKWLKNKNYCPLTNNYLDKSLLTSNIALKNIINDIENNIFTQIDPKEHNCNCECKSDYTFNSLFNRKKNICCVIS